MNFPKNPSKLTLGFVTQHCCIRVVKEAYCLRKMGYKVRLFTHRMPGYEQLFFNDISVHHNRREIRALVRSSPDVDIWHVHNEPTYLVNTVAGVTDKPVVFDVHDLHACRSGDGISDHFREAEQTAFDKCSATVHVSESYGKHANEFYGYKGPSITICSKTPLDWYQIPKDGDGVVYEGGVHTPLALRNLPYKDRDFSVLAENFMNADVPLYLYSATKKESCLWYEYGWGVHYMGAKDHFGLLSEMTKYGWGLILFPEKSNQVKWGMPNKLFDYLAAGLPVIGTKNTDFGRFIVDNGLGINFSYYDPLPEIPDHRAYKERILKIRDQLSMDVEITKLDKLYETLL